MESFYIDKLANSGVPVSISGKTWYVSQITLRDQGKLQAVIRKIQPSPLAEAMASIKSLPESIAKDVIRDARKEMAFYPHPLTSPEGLNLILSNEEGQKAILSACLGRNNTITQEEIESMADSMTYPMFMRIASIAISGEDPETDPKA